MSWIRSPCIDLCFFDFGWLLPAALFLGVSWTFDSKVCSYEYMDFICSHETLLVFGLVTYINDAHRYFTFPFVYGVKEEFEKHKKLYTWLPLVLGCMFAPVIFYSWYPEPYRSIAKVCLVVLITPNFFGNMYHIMMQKYGMFRIYGVKLGYGNPRLEKTLLLSWFVCMVIVLFGIYDRSLGRYVNAEFGMGLGRMVDPLFDAMAWLRYPAVIWTAVITALWLRQEYRNFRKASIPKLIFASATAMVLSCFFYSLLFGFVAFAASHAFEYIAFVNIYGRRKPGVPAWIKNPFILNPLLIFGVYAVYALLKKSKPGYHFFFAFTYFESYLHFAYDTVLWKMRDHSVRETVLLMDR